MGSQAVTKAVAKKLKYYVDIKRREDGFDLSGPYLPPQDPVRLRAGPTLAYDGLHDRSLKHYFHDPEMKKQIGKMIVPLEQSSRDMEIRTVLDTEMAKRSYSRNAGSTSPYLEPKERTTPKHRPRALISIDQYLKTKKGLKQRKIKPDILGKPKKVMRRSPPRHVSKNEQERIINTAARLIVATEKAALPGNRSSQSKEVDSSTYDSSLPDVNSKSSYTGDSSDSEMVIPSVCPRPPSRAGGPRPRWTPPRRSDSVQSEPSKGKSRTIFVKSPLAYSDDSAEVRQKNLKVSTKNTTRAGRPQTTSATGSKKQHLPSPQRNTRPRSAKYANRKPEEREKDMEDGVNGDHDSKKEKERKKHQTYSTDSFDDESDTADGSQQDNGESDTKLFYKRPLQNRTNSKNRILTYQVYVVTGNHRGAGTTADIRLTLFGEIGSSGERPLLKSMNHSRKFQKGQVDIFAVDSVNLGDLQNIRIGHSQTSPEYGWFLETVFVSEGPKEDNVFEFPCQRWFSSQKDDGQIVRDLCVSQLLTESALTDKLDDYASPREKSTDDDSYSSSSLSSDEYSEKEKDKEELSSDDHRSRAKKSKEKQRRKRSKEHGDKKRVSFEQDRAKKSWSGKENKGSGHESYGESEASEKEAERSNSRGSKSERSNSERSNSERSTPEKSNSGRSNSERSKSEGSSSEGEDTRGKRTKVKHPRNRNLRVKEAESNKSDDENRKEKKSEVEKSEVKKSDGEKSQVRTPESEKSGVEKTDEVKSSFEDDFWSNDAGKPEQIHYDLGIDNKGQKSKDTSPSDDDDYRSKESTDKRSEVKGDMDEEQKTGNQHDENEKEETSKDSSNDYMAGFMAGVKASEHDKEDKEQLHEENVLNESMEDEELMKKGPSLHIAVANGNLERVKEILQHNQALRQQTDEKGWIPLHVGCANGQLDCVKLIAVSGGNLEEETPTGYTSMHLAAMNGHVNCMMVLFALGVEINCRTIDEYTPLHLAAMSGHVECVKWLLANRAKHDVTDVNGRTPAEIAEEYCYDEVAKLLKSFKKELTRTDSTLAHLMTYEGTSKKSAESVSKVSDSEMGRPESEAESWISDDEHEEHSGKPPAHPGRPSSGKRVSSASSDGSVRPKNRTDSITTVEEKQKLYEKQRQQMKKRHSSFLDSIRMDVEDEIQNGDT